MNSKTSALNEKQLQEKLLEGQRKPSFEPLNLHENDTLLTDNLKSLCSKGPLFVLVHLIIIGYSYRKILIDLGIA